MPGPLKLQVEELGNEIAKLPERDRDFAQSLCEQFWARGLSQKQAYWVEKLLAKARNPHQAHQPQQVGSMAGVLALFAKAKRHLKYPAILLMVEGEEIVLRLSVAGERANVPGSINVADRDKFVTSTYGEQRVWYGRVTPEGEWQPHNRTEPQTATAIGVALKALAQNPAEVAAKYGRLTGRCCFCGKRLEDERSTAMGYGPVCAVHYDLPWGEVRHDFRKEEASASSDLPFNDAIGF